MDNEKIFFGEEKVNYLILIAGLFFIIMLGYRNQFVSFGVPLVISGWKALLCANVIFTFRMT